METASTSGDCTIQPRWDPKGYTRPWSRALYLQVRQGFLDRGESVSVVWGDRSGGSPGWRMQTFCEHTFEFKTLVDPIATWEFKELAVSPTLRIVPGDPARAVCLAPSQVLVDAPFTYHLKLEDRWGNPTALPAALCHPGFSRPGVQRLVACDQATGLAAESNPIEVIPHATPLHPYWADWHGQSEETVGSNSIEDYYTFARDYALLDISAHQGNDFQVTDEFWLKINDATRAFYRPGAFVTFPGYEWSGNTPLGGDRNVYFASEGGDIIHSCYDLLPGKDSAYGCALTVSELFDALKAQEGPRAFAFAHGGGRYADLRMHDPVVEVAVETHAAWGTAEFLVEDALRLGYRIGICANSDGHKCRPGASYPGASQFGSYGGLTCVLAAALDRESVLEALLARHIYATTGNRCLVAATLTTADGRRAMMGDVIAAGAGNPTLHIRAVGTAPIESVVVRNGLDSIETRANYGQGDLGNRIKVVWSGAEVRGRARQVAWDGGLKLTGNSILEATPINFWNAGRPLERIGDDQLAWRSITTGGLSGVILTLAEPYAGSLEIDTLQHRVCCDLADIGLTPLACECGGLNKRLTVYRLPSLGPSREIAIDLPLTHLHPGDNAIYIRLVQEDGHMAWTSPIYLTI